MHKVTRYLLLGLLFIFGIGKQYLYAQNFADVDYYLVEGLDITALSETDRVLIDTNLTIFHKEKSDTAKINAISKIVEESWDNNVWPKYNQWIFDFTQQLIQKGLTKSELFKRKIYLQHASAINNMGYLSSIQGEVPEALKLYLKSLAIQKEFNDEENIPTSLNNIGAIYNKLGDVSKALEYYHKSLMEYEKYNNDQGFAQTLNNIGHIYENQKDRDLALEYFHRSLSLYKKLKIERGIATLLNSIGYVYFRKENVPKALTYYFDAYEIREKMNDQKGMASSLNNIASAYENQNEIVKALEFYNKSLTIYEATNHKEGLSTTLNNLGRLYLKRGDIKKAQEYAAKSLSVAQETKVPDNIRASAFTLSSIYETEGNTKKALELFKLSVFMKDSINNERTQKSATKLQAKYEYETNKAIDDAENDKVLAIKEEEKKQQTIISIAIGVGLFLVVIFLLFVANRLKVTRKQKVVIEEQNKEIVDSITYAKRIQDAILPTNKWIKNCLPDSFVYYQPKDIVAGDFYWVENVSSNRHSGLDPAPPKKSDDAQLNEISDIERNEGNVVLFAAADCTGHGVPGAMMSVVCHNAMNRVVGEFNVSEPGEILNKTREIIVEQLNKAENKEIETIGNIRDGMDIALCSFNSKTYELQYAGAHNPLWILRKGAAEFEEIKATKQSVGNVDNPKSYSNHTVQLNKGDIIYLFSDGYADQFGGAKGKKLKSKPFKQLLINNANKSMSEQRDLLKCFFNDWKGDLEQIDDVCVVGVRV